MSSLSLRLAASLHQKVRELAKRDEVSINQFIATAVAEKAAALLTVAYLEDRARRGNAQLFDRVLARVRDVPPAPGDDLPQKGSEARGRGSEDRRQKAKRKVQKAKGRSVR